MVWPPSILRLLGESETSRGGIETGVVIGLLPVGLVVAVRRRKKQS